VNDWIISSLAILPAVHPHTHDISAENPASDPSSLLYTTPPPKKHSFLLFQGRAERDKAERHGGNGRQVSWHLTAGSVMLWARGRCDKVGESTAAVCVCGTDKNIRRFDFDHIMITITM
jgi:hypothetical protein